MSSGVSANLCEALVRIIEPFPTLDVQAFPGLGLVLGRRYKEP